MIIMTAEHNHKHRGNNPVGLIKRSRNAGARIVLRFATIAVKPKDLSFQKNIYFPKPEERIIWIRPGDIKFSTPKGRGITSLSRKFIVDGDWDIRNKTPRTMMHQTIKELFIDGLPYQQCSQYLKMQENMERGDFGGAYWCRTTDEINQYFLNLIAAYEDIKRNGYKRQVQLGKSGEDEIRGYVDRYSDLIIGGGGNHRLAIAEMLGVEWIPFYIVKVHYQWVNSLVERYNCSVGRAIKKGLAEIDRSAT